MILFFFQLEKVNQKELIYSAMHYGVKKGQMIQEFSNFSNKIKKYIKKINSYFFNA